MNELIGKLWFRIVLISVVSVATACCALTAAAIMYLGGHGLYSESNVDFTNNIIQDDAIDNSYRVLNEAVHYTEDDKGNVDLEVDKGVLLQDERYDYTIFVNGKVKAETYDDKTEYYLISPEANGIDGEGFKVTVKAYLKSSSYVDSVNYWTSKAYSIRYGLVALVILFAAMFIAGLVLLIVGTKCSRKKWPADLYTALSIAAAVIIFNILATILYPPLNSGTIVMFLIMVFIGGTLLTALFLLWIICLTMQIKGKVLIASTIIVRIIKGIVYGFKQLPDVWRIVIPSAVCIFIGDMLIGATAYTGESFSIAFACGVMLLAVIWYLAVMMNRITKGAREIRDGNTSYAIDTNKMPPVLREHAETINKINEAVDAAVAEQMKSERLKTELITNVSHDIKTPLTSIINYTELLEGEEIDSDKADEYLQVISANANRLKKLTSDIVEASKISTGNISVERTNCELKTMLNQALGEYEEKMEELSLIPVVKLPDEDVTVLADGKHSWRIIDNIMNNICKYAQPETRVYMEIYKDDRYGYISFKNISKQELDISSDELMERFVRGDESRNTEGSGLGLSIGRDLAKAQGGELEITIDGDLFKNVIKFEID